MAICPICKDKDFSKLEVGIDSPFYLLCPSCSFVQMDQFSFLSDFKEKIRYELHENSSGDHGYVAWLKRFLCFAFKGIDPIVVERKTRVLDFGSGPQPVMAGLMSEMGFDVFYEDKYFKPGRCSGSFDVITSVEVFEHLNDPLLVLSDLARRLNPGGSICISTEFRPDEAGLFEKWHYRSDPTHISFFRSETLSIMANIAGLELVEHDGRRYARFKSLSQDNRNASLR